MEHVAEIARLVLVVTFGVASLAKLRSPGTVAARIEAFGVRAPVSVAMTYLVGVTESAIAIAFALGSWTPQASTLSAVLLLIFSMSLVMRRSAGPCGCGLPGDHLPNWVLLVRNSLLTAAAGFPAFTVGPQPYFATTMLVAIGIAAMAVFSFPATSVALGRWRLQILR